MIARVVLGFLALAFVTSAAPHEPVTKVASYYQYWFPNMAPDNFFVNSPKEVKARSFAAGPVSGCNKLQLAFCQQRLADDLGVDLSLFKDPLSLAQAVADYYAKENVTEGLLPLCTAQIRFRQCMQVWYQPCTDALQIFKMNGGKIQDAFTLAGVYDDLEFDCGGGLVDGLLNWDCIQQINNNDKFADKISKCYNNYINHVNDTGRYCAVGQIYAQCLTLVYKTLGKSCVNNEIQWWVCERAIRRTRLDGYCPQNSCDTIFPVPTGKPPTASPTSSNPGRELMEFINSGGLFAESEMNHFRQIAEKHQRRQ